MPVAAKGLFFVCWTLASIGRENCTPPLDYYVATSIMNSIHSAYDNIPIKMEKELYGIPPITAQISPPKGK